MSKINKIVEAASQRFRYYGINKTTMQEIAQDAGVAVGTLYLYFSNKDDLIVACTAGFVERHRRAAEQILASDLSPDEKVRAYLLDRYRHSEEIRTGSRHAAELTQAVLRLKPDRIEEEGMMMWETITTILKAGVAAKQFAIDDPGEDGKVLLYSLGRFFPNALGAPVVTPTEEELLLVVNWFLRVWQRKPSRVKKRARAG